MKDGAKVFQQSISIPIEANCVDVSLAGLRIKVSYDSLSKTFFVATGMDETGFEFGGRDGIPIGVLYDALMPLAKGKL